AAQLFEVGVEVGLHGASPVGGLVRELFLQAASKSSRMNSLPRCGSAHLAQRRGAAWQHAGQHFGDIAEEQGAQRALVVLRVGAADGQDTQLALVAQADYRGGADLLAVLGEQE